MKRILSLLIAAVLIFPTGGLSVFAEGDVVSGLSSLSAIKSAGLVASDEYTKSGLFSAKLSGADLHRNITLKVSQKDFSESEYLEFYIYSPEKTDSSIAISLYSDNKETICKDYYVKLIDVGFKGWKLFSLSLNDFNAVHTPKGMDSIDSITIMPSYGGEGADENAVFYFDDFKITKEMTEGANTVEGEAKDNIFVIADFTNPTVALKAGFPSSGEYVRTGDSALKWAGETDLKKTLSVKFDDVTDMSGYGELCFDMYSVKATGDYGVINLTSENEGSDGWDYYSYGFNIDWEGWKEFRIKIGDKGEFTASRNPKGWDSVSEFSMSLNWRAWENIFPSPDTEVYIETVYLQGESNMRDNSADYIIDNQYNSETMTDIASMIKEKNPDKAHPRLILTKEKIDEINETRTTDAFVKKAYNAIISSADTWCTTELTPSTTRDGLRLSWNPGEMFQPLCLAYIFTGDAKYKERIWAEVENISGFPTWNPSHFLDVGEYGRGIAFAYDWLYDEWDENQKRIMRNAMMEFVLQPAVSQIRAGEGSWLSQRSNWIEVGASGVGLCCLAIMDEPGYEDICNEVINGAVSHMKEKGMFIYNPDGAYSEGPGYWEYATRTMMLLSSALKTSAGTDMGIEEYPGIDKTGYFPVAMRGPVSSFNFSDSDKTANAEGESVYHYLSTRFSLPFLKAYRMNKAQTLDFMDLLWYDKEQEYSINFGEGLKKDYFASGHEPLGSFRSGYDSNAYYIGFKGGNNQGNHDHLDIGSFVLQANGISWIEELPSDTYYGKDHRFTYYRNRAEGQNTLVLNPDSDIYDQVADAYSDFTDKRSEESGAYAIFDITGAYSGDAEKVKRGFGLINNRTQFIVQDEIVSEKGAEVYSFFHTSKDNAVKISEDKKSAVLTNTETGKQMRVDVISPQTAKIDVMNAEHLASSPTPKDNDGLDNSTFHKLFIHAGNVKNETFTVVFTSVNDGEEITLPEFKPFSEWDSYLDTATVQNIMIDGITLPEFSEGVGVYTVRAENIGVVTASAGENTVTVTQAEQYGDAAVINVQSASGETGTYKILFEPQINPPVDSGYDVLSCEASSVPQAGNGPKNTYDGSLSTRWSAEGQQWMVWDLGEEKTLDQILMAFYSGDTRKNVLKLEVSKDGEIYKTVFDGKSSGTTNELEAFGFDMTKARFIRYRGYGNEAVGAVSTDGYVSQWNSISEVVFPVAFTDFSDITSHWAKDDINYLRKYQLVNGVSDTEFAPDKAVTGAEFITMISRACDFEEREYNGAYPNITKDKWYAGFVQAAKDNGIIPDNMTEDGNFYAENVLTRAQMCAISVKAYEKLTGIKIKTDSLDGVFGDIEKSPYRDYILKGYSLNLVKGISDGEFLPEGALTRAQTATIIKRLFLELYNQKIK